MDEFKRNALIILIVLVILTSAGIVLYFQKETREFKNFSAEVPYGSDFADITPENDSTIIEMWRCLDYDLTITSFNSTYIEKEYFKENNIKIDYVQSMIDHLSDENTHIENISDNLTRIIQTADGDCDVACIYHNSNQSIIVEGEDVDFITEIARSIKI